VGRKIPPHRFDDLVRGATDVFIAHGYRHAQMADVAEAVGVSKATLYLYVESKEALFALCALHADRRDPVPKPDPLPVPTPPAGELAARMKQRLDRAGALPLLMDALGRPRAESIRAEFGEILRELYTSMEAHCHGIKLIDRCWDHPELGPLWQERGRRAPRNHLAEYMQLRMRAGQLRAHPVPRLHARIAIETIATWALHIKWDPSPQAFDPVAAKQAVIDYILQGLLSETEICKEVAP
jgi:AcrR family transcriptional regulator